MSRTSDRQLKVLAKCDAAQRKADTRFVYVDDLPESTRGERLICSVCGDEYSATRGDYFWMAKDQPFMCECGEPMSLVIEVRHYVTLKGEEVD